MEENIKQDIEDSFYDAIESTGDLIDINPFNNPVVYKSGRVSPKGAKYNPKAAGTFSKTHPIVKAFLDLGWRWGGDFRKYKDNHHFDKKK